MEGHYSITEVKVNVRSGGPVPSRRPREFHVPRLIDERGRLLWLEGDTLPIQVRRVYCLESLAAGGVRGGHAHKDLQQVMFALAGSLDINVVGPDGDSIDVTLQPFQNALYLPAAHWRSVNFRDESAVCGVLASQEFSEADYIRDFDEFQRWTSCAKDFLIFDAVRMRWERRYASRSIAFWPQDASSADPSSVTLKRPLRIMWGSDIAWP